MTFYRVAKILEEWQAKTHVQMMFSILDDTVFVYTEHPGILIGQQGNLINEMSKKLNALYPEAKIKLVETYELPYTMRFDYLFEEGY